MDWSRVVEWRVPGPDGAPRRVVMVQDGAGRVVWRAGGGDVTTVALADGDALVGAGGIGVNVREGS